MINAISYFIIETDKLCEKIPFVSTLTTIVKIFLRSLTNCFRRDFIQSSHFLSYIHNQSRIRLFFLLIPGIGNLTIWLIDAGLRALPGPGFRTLDRRRG